MASSTGNFVSRFAPQSYFFTTAGAFTQSAEQTFGPLSDSQYRVTTLLNFSSAAMAYAAFMGVALIQPQTGNDERVNLILRPFRQPIVGLNIKYFIYRGLLKSDFLIGTTVIELSTDASDLVNVANKSFTDFYHKFYPEESVPSFEAKFLGYDPANQPEATLINKLFFKRSETNGTDQNPAEDPAAAFELPLVQQGASLGRFAQGEGGLDIVLSYGDYELPQPNDEFVFNLTYARATNWIIDLNGVSGDFKKKQTKEHIFQFLDSAAYYGFHAIDDGWVKIKSNGNDVTKKGEQIYNDLLQGYTTKNTFYLYIKSDRTRSYNFYDNYRIGNSGNTSLRYGTLEANMAEREYATDGWPVIIENTPQGINGSVTEIYLQPVTDNNAGTAVYGLAANIANAESNNFCSAAYLANPDAPAFTKPLILDVHAIGAGGQVKFISSFNIILYKGKKYKIYSGETIGEEGTAVDSFVEPKMYDDIFGKVNALSLLKLTSQEQTDVVTEKDFNIFSRLKLGKLTGITALGTSKIKDVISDSVESVMSRMTFVIDPIDALSDVMSLSGAVSNSSVSRSNLHLFKDGTYRLPDPYYLSLRLFSDDALTVTGLEIMTRDNSIPNLNMLGLKESEYQTLNSLIGDNEIDNPMLCFINFYSEQKAAAAEGVTFEKYKMGIAGESGGVLQMFLPLNDVIVYTLDGNCLFSSAYSKNVKEDYPGNLVLALNISLDLAE